MDYTQFKAMILQQLQQLLGADTSVHLQTIHKNNGVLLDGLVISCPRSNLSPTIFLNHYYENKDFFPDIDAICRDILLTYEQNKPKQQISTDFFTDYTILQDRISYRLIHYEKNKELLKTVPYIRYLDLAIVFYCLLTISPNSSATILIHSNHLKLWGITVRQLYDQACRTAPVLLPYDFRNLSSVLSGLLHDAAPAERDAVKAAAFCPMYVLTNTQKLYGAGCMLYPGLLEAISEKLDADLYLLPSSIHEVILLPAESRICQKELAEMVDSINRTELAADEILSSSVYYYSRTQQALSICT